MISTSGNSVTVPSMAIDTGTARELRKAARHLSDALAKRDDLIRNAVAGGGSLREVAQCVGLTHVGVMKIVQRAQTKGTQT